MELSPHCLTAGRHARGLRSLTDFGIPVGTLDRSVLYILARRCPTLPLKAFRREPAITQLDKSFAPILSSFQTFSTVTDSRLHPRLGGLHAVQG